MSLAGRKELLDEVAKAVLVDRTTTHGDVEDNFSTIAAYWTEHLIARGLLVRGVSLAPQDVAVMQALLKCARLAKNFGHRDNWADGGGYFVCGGGMSAAVTPQLNAPPKCSECHKLHHTNVPCEEAAHADLMNAMRPPPDPALFDSRMCPGCLAGPHPHPRTAECARM